VARRRTGRFPLVAPFVFRVRSELPTTPDPLEAVEAVWIPLARLRDPAQHGLRPVPGFPSESLFPSVAIGTVPLWGFTYHLMTTWLGLAETDAELPGFKTADRILGFLSAQGLRTVQAWTRRKVAVAGEIPVAAVLDYLSTQNGEIPAVNLVEVRPELVRIVGLAFEEYVIDARS
jgi:hypothetical protein